MWVMMNDSFLSIVQDQKDPRMLMVRARKAGDIRTVFPDASVAETTASDYRYRASIRRSRVVERIAARLQNVDYPNFKDSVEDEERHDAYLEVWQTMMLWGNGVLKRRPVFLPGRKAPAKKAAPR